VIVYTESEALCYADDNGLLTEDPKDMQENLEVVNEFCRATGMKLNVKKSAGYDIKPNAIYYCLYKVIVYTESL
jgi:hypothetical protein